MVYYLSVITATVLLAIEFSCSKLYQSLESISLEKGLQFNTVSGLVSALIMWALAGFRLEWSGFSALLALGMALCSMLYCLLSFRILNLGGMVLYSLALMNGGMLLPYIFGIVFLNETVSLPGFLGLIAVLAAVILSNFNRRKISKTLLLLCTAVFLLNGFCSILSKAHQISRISSTVGSAGFVMYSGIAKCLLSVIVLLCRKRSSFSRPKHKYTLLLTVGAAVISAASYLLQLNGTKVLPASVLYPMITGGSIVFSAIAGRVFFKERLSLRQILCILLCIFGTWMLVI